MNQNLNEQLLTEARRIGDLVLQEATEHTDGLSWASYRLGYQDELERFQSASLSHGTAGIALYLLELATASGEPRYQEAALQAARYAATHCQQHATENYSFYTGYLGVSWLLGRCYQQTQDTQWWEQAMAIATDGAEAFLKSPYAADDLYQGRSGALLALLLLYEIQPDSRLVPLIERFATYLLDNLILHKDGICWRDRLAGIQPQIGFGQGNGGICFVLDQLAAATGNEALSYWATQSRYYLLQQWQRGGSIWPDYRKGISNESEHQQHLAALATSDEAFFTKPGQSWGWLAGNDGLLHLSGLGEEKTEQVATKAIKAFDHLSNDSLLNGRAGLLLALQRLAPEHEAIAKDLPALTGKLLKKEATGYTFFYNSLTETPNLGLMEGLAGLGYAYLQLSGGATFNLLHPAITTKTDLSSASSEEMSILDTERSQIRKRILQKSFKRSLRLLMYQHADETVELLARMPKEGNLRHVFMNWFEANIGEEASEQLQDVYQLESEMVELSDQVESYALVNAREIARQQVAEELLNLSDADLLHTSLISSEEAHAIENNWDWINEYDYEANKAVEPEDHLSLDPDEYLVLLKPNANGTAILAYPLNELSAPVYQAFDEEQTAGTAIAQLAEMFEFEDPADEQQLQQLAIDQIREFINTGILIKAV